MKSLPKSAVAIITLSNQTSAALVSDRSKIDVGDPSTSSVGRSAIPKDPMSFSLFNSSFGTRLPTNNELVAIHDHFPSCCECYVRYGIIVLKCETPPSIIPLVVAGLPAVFVTLEEDYNPIPGRPCHPRVRGLPLEHYKPSDETPFDFLTE